jgi:hypothetical protein
MLMRLPKALPVWQHAATLEPQACWMGTATVMLRSVSSSGMWFRL